MLRNSAVIGQQFAFAHGRSGVLQQFLLSQQDIDRLLGAHDRKEVEQILTELRFTKNIDQSLRDPHAILEACRLWVRREIAAMSPEAERAVFDILWMEGDLPLVAYLLKRRKGLTSDISSEPEPAFTAYAPESLRALVENGNAEGLPKDLITGIGAIREKNVDDARLIDAAVSQLGADLRVKLATESGSKAIIRYVRHSIDMENIRTTLRFAQDERTASLPHLIFGGSIPPKDLTGNNAQLAARLRMAGFHVLADNVESNDHSAIERMLNDIVANDIADMWNVILRVEPVFAFAATALAHLRILRAVVLGKRNELSPQEIKRILPPFLSASHYVS